MRSFLLVMTVMTVLWCFLSVKSSTITFQENGYSNINVAIDNSVPEDATLISNLKALFTSASSFLHNATKGWAHFNNITVVVPYTWSEKKEYDTAVGYFFTHAHVRINTAKNWVLDEESAFTFQPGQCGEPGVYIGLTPGFVALGDKPEAGKLLVHEWAKFRYGVFEEHGHQGHSVHPVVYIDTDENGFTNFYPTACGEDIKGWLGIEDGTVCTMYSDGTVNPECKFTVNNTSNATTSVMSHPTVTKIDGFCEEDMPGRKHIRKAPSKHNIQCKYMSTWSVIANHTDFINFTKNHQLPLVNTTPTFRIVRQRSKVNRYVFTIDVSGSMSVNDRLNILKKGAKRFIVDRIPNESYVGLVTFATSDEIVHNLTELDQGSRRTISQKIDELYPQGATAIGSGLTKAAEIAQTGDLPPEGAVIILITDGDENMPPYIDAVSPQLQSLGIMVYSVAMGPDASVKLEGLVTATRGKGFYFPDNASRSDLDSAFLEILISNSEDTSKLVTVLQQELTLNSTDVTETSVLFDALIGKNTTFMFTSQNIGDVEVKLIDSSGSIFIKSMGNSANSANHVQFDFEETQGLWKVELRKISQTSIHISFVVTSEPKDLEDQPVHMTSWFSENDISTPKPVKVYASLLKGNLQVINATVVAKVKRPKGQSVTLRLFDNGAGADVTKDDGIYTGVFTQFSGTGRYSAKTYVEPDGHARLKKATKVSTLTEWQNIKKGFPSKKTKPGIPSKAFPITDFITVPEKPTILPISEMIQPFQRWADAGSFQVSDWVENETNLRFRPERITDLIVTEVDDFARTAVLRWTSPGPVERNTTASSIILTMSQNEEFVLTLNPSLDMLINVTVAEPGTVQIITVELSNVSQPSTSGGDYYFAVRIIEEDLQGDISNIAVGHFGLSKLFKDRQRKISLLSLKVVGIVVGVVALLRICAIVAIMYHHRKPRLES